MYTIKAMNLSKHYTQHKKQEGLKGSVRNLFRRETYEVSAVKDVSFVVERGEILGLIGPNGAGKTTTVKMMSGLLSPSSGSIEVLGFNPFDKKRDFLKKIGLVMGNKNQLIWDIPAMDSFLLFRDIYEIPEAQFRSHIDKLSKLLSVESLLKVPVRNLSLGERMKMEVIGSILHSPEALYLDEPTIGLDIIAQKNLRQFIKEYNERYGTTIILTSHYMSDIVHLCKRILIINHGEIMYDGSLSDIMTQIESMKIINITFNEPPSKELFQGVMVKATSDLSYTIHVERCRLQRFIDAMLSQHPNDFTVEDPPIEDIIEHIYMTGVRGTV